MTRNLQCRLNRLEHHMSAATRKVHVIWARTDEDRTSIEARAKARGYVEGDALYILSWMSARQPEK